MGDGAGAAVTVPARGPFGGLGKQQQQQPQATPLKARVEKVFGGDSDDDDDDDDGWAGVADDLLDQAMTAHEQKVGPMASTCPLGRPPVRQWDARLPIPGVA